MGPGDGWTEMVDTTETLDGQPLPEGAVTISGGFKSVEAVLAVKDGRVTAVKVAEECTWWDDRDTTQTWAPEEGETLHVLGWRTESDFVQDSLDERDEVSYDPEIRTYQTWARTVEQARNMSASYLKSIGAYRDAEDRRKAAMDEISVQKKERYERARDRAELLYPYNGGRVFKARIRWALDERVASCAKALAPYVKGLRPNLRPLGGWPCNHSRLPEAWHRAYGCGGAGDAALDDLMSVCKTLSQPRLDAAWEVACVLAR